MQEDRREVRSAHRVRDGDDGCGADLGCLGCSASMSGYMSALYGFVLLLHGKTCSNLRKRPGGDAQESGTI